MFFSEVIFPLFNLNAESCLFSSTNRSWAHGWENTTILFYLLDHSSSQPEVSNIYLPNQFQPKSLFPRLSSTSVFIFKTSLNQSLFSKLVSTSFYFPNQFQPKSLFSRLSSTSVFIFQTSLNQNLYFPNQFQLKSLFS